MFNDLPVPVDDTGDEMRYTQKLAAQGVNVNILMGYIGVKRSE
jgi:hypothetical protein